jgi:hypothetical protein
MRLMFAVVLALAVLTLSTASYACPPGYADCGRGVCCPQ